MKRIKWFDKDNNITLWDAICDIENIKLAHQKASKGKRWYKEVKMVNSDPDYYLKQIQIMLQNGTYKVSDYTIFEKKEGEKIRKIYKLPYYPDRIIQWAVILIIGPILERKFISHTYSSIKNRGQHQCLYDVKTALKNKQYQYCLKIDIKKFYPSINQNIMKTIYSKIFKDKQLLQFINQTLESVPEKDGIPIGNYLSQYSGNLYLTYFDHWIKEELKIKAYFRYMDDMVFLSNDKQILQIWLKQIKKYLQQNLKLQLKENFQVYPITARGIDFVGYRIFHKYCLIRKQIALNYKIICVSWKNKQLTQSKISAYMSYKGLLSYANTYNLQQKYFLEVSK